MPKSRKRKTRRGTSSSRSTRSSKKNSKQLTRAVVYVIIAAIAVAAVLFIVLRGGSSTPSPSSVGEVTGPGGEVTTPSGLKYLDEVVGSGASPRQGQNVTVHYTGTLENGTKFDSSVDRGQPYTFRIGTRVVIQGWDEGIMTMKVGGKRRLTIPANLAYGAAGRPGIPPNATLLFEVELLGAN